MFKVGDKVKYNTKRKLKPCLSEKQMSVFFDSILGEMLKISKIDGVACEFENCDGKWFLSDFELVNKGTDFLKENCKKLDKLVEDDFISKIKQLVIDSCAPIIAENVALKAENEVLRLLNKMVEEPKPLDTYHGEYRNPYHYISEKFKNLDGINSALEIDEFDFNCFRTKDQAEQARKHLQITCALLNFRAENDKNNLSWDTATYMNFFIVYDHDAKKFKTMSSNKYNECFGCVYFSNQELARSALDMLKRKGLV